MEEMRKSADKNPFFDPIFEVVEVKSGLSLPCKGDFFSQTFLRVPCCFCTFCLNLINKLPFNTLTHPLFQKLMKIEFSMLKFIFVLNIKVFPFNSL